MFKLLDKALDKVSERLAANLCDNLDTISQQDERLEQSQVKASKDLHICEYSQTLKPSYDKPWHEPDPELEHLISIGHWQRVNDVNHKAYLSA